MKQRSQIVGIGRWGFRVVALAIAVLAFSVCRAADDPPDAVLDRAAKQVSSFLEVMSSLNCTELVVQEKLGPNGKVIEKQASTYDYLIMFSTESGDVSLTESRLAAGEAKQHKKPGPALLISNGFSTLFVIFHPYYAAGFQFTKAGEEAIDGRALTKVHFQHIPGTRSPAALAVRGREYPLDFQGTAWIDAETGVIHKLTANIESGMEDVGLESLHSEIKFALTAFHDPPESFWLPAEVTVEVQTRHQHWRNTHEFSAYRRFAVNTKEQVAKQ